jgi:pSer/pThr/pTyr-binding forkhead associated (FHA) protein
MIKCPHCHSVYPENTLFCKECGSYLAGSTEQGTDPLAGQTAAEVEQAAPAGAGFTTLTLAIRDGGRIELPLSKEVVLGRLDAGQAIFPDVDLAGEQGIEKGVSRRHCRIVRRGGLVFVEDLGSLNGTYLNASRLAPELPYPVKDGDEVQLGKLILTIHLK